MNCCSERWRMAGRRRWMWRGGGGRGGTGGGGGRRRSGSAWAFFALWDRLPSEASPSIPLHFVEREGPEIGVVGFRQTGSSRFPFSTPWRRGQGMRPRRADRPKSKDVTDDHPLSQLSLSRLCRKEYP